MKKVYFLIVLLLVSGKLCAQFSMGSLHSNVIGQMVNSNPGVSQMEQFQFGGNLAILCLADNCFEVQYESPRMYYAQFNEHRSDEAWLANNWILSGVISSMPWSVRQSFDWFLYTPFQAPAVSAPVDVSLKFNYSAPKAPGSLPYAQLIIPVEKKFTIQN